MTQMLEWPDQPFQPGDLCEWFALCLEPAVDHRPHPILGDVPVCETHRSFPS